MCIITALFSVGKREFFLPPKPIDKEEDAVGALDFNLVNSLLFEHVDSILQLCYSTSDLTYQNFSLLGLWTSTAKGRERFKKFCFVSPI